MSLKDHIQQELNRIHRLEEIQAHNTRSVAEERLKAYCDRVEIQLKAALAQNLLSCTINVPPEYTAEKVMSALVEYKHLPRKAMSISYYDDGCPCGSSSGYGCTCSDSVLLQIVPKQSVTVSFKLVCEE